MDLKKYDELRKKISTKDFEGNNKGLDKWLFSFSYVGNISAIFFAYFLVYPALLKTITVNFLSGSFGQFIAFLFAVVFLTIFEITKRYLVRNFSSDFMANKMKVNASLLRWLVLSILIITLSFYLSIEGSRNLAQTRGVKDDMAKTEVTSKTSELTNSYENRKRIYLEDNNKLREVNNDLRKKLAETPLNYQSARKEYQASIDKNVKLISDNQAEINKIDAELENKLNTLNSELQTTQIGNASEDFKNVILFIIIVIFNEVIIIGGLFFREWYEYNLYELNRQKFDKIIERKNRYRALIGFIYNDGKANVGDKVISGLELKDIVAEKTNIPNSNKFVDEFLKDMDRLGVFMVDGKRRLINVTYDEAKNTVENHDEALRILENLK